MGLNRYMHFVYILRSQRDHGWYIGYSTDVDRRLAEHNSGRNISTYSRRPLQLIYYEAYLHKMDALGREKFLKSGSGRRFIEKQLRHYLAEGNVAPH